MVLLGSHHFLCRVLTCMITQGKTKIQWANAPLVAWTCGRMETMISVLSMPAVHISYAANPFSIAHARLLGYHTTPEDRVKALVSWAGHTQHQARWGA